MFRPLTGREPGLAGLWNFDGATNHVVKDLSAGGHDGKLIGNARVVPCELPAPAQLHEPAVVFGTVKDETGKSLPTATVRVLYLEQVLSTAASGPDGTYSIALLREDQTFDIQAGAGDLGAWELGASCSHGKRTELNLTLSNAVASPAA